MKKEEKMRTKQEQLSTLRLLGNKLCLDFANTIDPRSGEQRYDYLTEYGDLVWWTQYVDLFSEEEARHLLAAAERSPSQATFVFQRALLLRETIYAVFSAIASQTEPKHSDLDVLTAVYREEIMHIHIVRVENTFKWNWEEGHALASPLWPLVQSACELLFSAELDRLKMCPLDEGCGWLFFDTSKNGSRRWCRMESCGSRAKMRKQRSKASSV